MSVCQSVSVSAQKKLEKLLTRNQHNLLEMCATREPEKLFNFGDGWPWPLTSKAILVLLDDGISNQHTYVRDIDPPVTTLPTLWR